MNNIQYIFTGETGQRAGSIQSRPCVRPAIVKLTDIQRAILSAAAARDDGALLPPPPSLSLTKGATTRVLKGLVRKGLAAEISASPDDVVWRLDEGGERLTLVITDQGLAALGIEHRPDGARQVDQKDTKPASTAPERAVHKKRSKQAEKAAQRPDAHPKPATRISVVIKLLRRDEGATVTDIMAATGWQAHSVRGVLSGTVRKKLGYSVASQAVEGRGRVYRIAEEEVSQ